VSTRLLASERQAVLLAAFTHLGQQASCSLLAVSAREAGLLEDDVEALLGGGVPRDKRLAALAATALLLLDSSGTLTGVDLADLEAAGIEHVDQIEVAALVGIEIRISGRG